MSCEALFPIRRGGISPGAAAAGSSVVPAAPVAAAVRGKRIRCGEPFFVLAQPAFQFAEGEPGSAEATRSEPADCPGFRRSTGFVGPHSACSTKVRHGVDVWLEPVDGGVKIKVPRWRSGSDSNSLLALQARNVRLRDSQAACSAGAGRWPPSPLKESSGSRPGILLHLRDPLAPTIAAVTPSAARPSARQLRHGAADAGRWSVRHSTRLRWAANASSASGIAGPQVGKAAGRLEPAASRPRVSGE